MVAVDSQLKPTTNHSMGTYLWKKRFRLRFRERPVAGARRTAGAPHRLPVGVCLERERRNHLRARPRSRRPHGFRLHLFAARLRVKAAPGWRALWARTGSRNCNAAPPRNTSRSITTTTAGKIASPFGTGKTCRRPARMAPLGKALSHNSQGQVTPVAVTRRGREEHDRQRRQLRVADHSTTRRGG